MDWCLVVGVCCFWNYHFHFFNHTSRISTRISRNKRNAQGTYQERKHSKSPENWKTNFENTFAGSQRYINKLDVSLQHAGADGNIILRRSTWSVHSKSSFVEVWCNSGKSRLCSWHYANTSYGRYGPCMFKMGKVISIGKKTFSLLPISRLL